MDTSVGARLLFPTEQASQVFGITFNPRERPIVQRPDYWAQQESAPPDGRPANDNTGLRRYDLVTAPTARCSSSPPGSKLRGHA